MQQTIDHRRQSTQPTRGWQAAVRSWPDDAARAWVRDAVETASKNASISAIVATGSAVRAVDSSDDLDLVIVYRERPSGLPRPPISIDLQQHEQAAVPLKLADGHDYLSWAVRFGRALFERDLWWTRLRAEWNGRLQMPSAAEARRRALRAKRLHNELETAGDTDAAAEMRLSMLTHLGRAALSGASVFPKSRPEMADQLSDIGEKALADRLAQALALRNAQ